MLYFISSYNINIYKGGHSPKSMTEENNGPNKSLLKKRNPHGENYIGKYISIYPPGIGTTFSGKLIAIENGYGILSPYQSGEYNEEGKVVKKIYNGKATVPLINSAIEPTTRRSLENMCRQINEKKEEKKEEKDDSKKQ
jgi:hypothetical protein